MYKLVSRLRPSLIAFGTLLGSCAVMYMIIHSPIVILMCIIVALHELAHGIAAVKFGGNLSGFYFIPLGLVILCITKIKNISSAHRKYVAAMGPIVGCLSAIGICAALFIMNHMVLTPLILAGLVLALTEAGGLVIGSDAKKIRA